jgi:hypothetical protein
MSKIVIAILIYHRHKPIDSINLFGAYPNHMHIQIIVKNNLLKKKKKGKNEMKTKEKHNSTDTDKC